jgi:hypothetical protein
MKAFISYSSYDKNYAANVKQILDRFGVDSFMAHEDIRTSHVWMNRIIEELKVMDVFIPLISSNFIEKSDWTQQECGFAFNQHVVRKVQIVPLMIEGSLPTGFLSTIQGSSITDLLENLIRPLLEERPLDMIDAIINDLRNAGTYRYAENVMQLLLPYYDKFNKRQVDKFVNNSISNNQVFDASRCATDYIPRFVKINRKKLANTTVKKINDKISWVNV